MEKPLADEQPANLLSSVSTFISQLTNVLSDTTKANNLAKSLPRKDETTGQTYFQIPLLY